MISICNITKNRNENLEKCWRTWLFADEIIIMDYGSSIPVKIDHPKVKVYRYESDGFIKTKGLNMAIDLAKGDIIIQADSDYYFNRHFSEKDLHTGEFITGKKIIETDDRDIVSLTGFCMFWKYDWERVNGFNERFIYYAYDDCDFYNRLEGIGLNHNKINLGDITHLTHSDSERIVNFVSSASGRMGKILYKSREKNVESSIKNPWTAKDIRSKYEKIQ